MPTLFTPEQTTVAGLLVFRLTGLVWTAPLFSARTLAARVKVALTGLLAILLYPAAIAAAPAGIEFSAQTVVAELVVGITLGIGAAIFVGAAEAAGDMVAVQMGLSGANVLDPNSATQMPVLGQFMGLFVLALILGVGGHIVILEALAASLERVPSGSVVGLNAGVEAVLALGANLFALGVRFAAPMVAALLISNVALGVMARTTPQLNVLMVAFPIQIAVGLFMLAVTLPMLAGFFSGFNGVYEGVAVDLLGTLAGSNGVGSVAPGGVR